jgi:eukaryotic-like serine/threonine-protein kinase
VRVAPLPDIPGFRVLRRLGRGGFASVYACVREGEAETIAVAVKVSERHGSRIDERFAREVHALRAIGPPHAPRVAGEGALADGSPWVAMEHVAAPTLAEILARDGPLPPAAAVDVFRRLLAAVRAAHAKGFVHRDLKPGNFLVCDDPPHAKLIDFGLAGAARSSLTGVDVSSAPPNTWRPSSGPAARPTSGPTSTRSA